MSHAALGAYHQGKAVPLGMVALLDGGEEDVEIDMHDEAGHARWDVRLFLSFARCDLPGSGFPRGAASETMR